jgi:ankyrin repeat protein
MTAARQNSVECTQLLLAAGSNPDTVWKQNNNSTALICAAESGSGEVMRLLIRAGANVNVKNAVGQTALHVAVEKNSPEHVRLLLRYGADASIQDNDGQTGLIVSTKSGFIDCMYLILGSGCDRNVQDTKGNTALLWAAWQGNIDCLKLLLKAGCDANLQNQSGNTAAIICADANAHECLKCIVQQPQERAVEFDRTNKEGDSAVVISARKNHMESFQLLIGCVGVNLNIRDAKGNTALIWCVCNANPHSTKMLLEVGGCGGRVVEVGAQNQFGHTALMFAAERSDNVECLKLLIEATSTNTDDNAVSLLDMKNSNGDTALLLAVKNKCVEAIKLLVAAGADIDIQDSATGSTALHLAVKDNSKEMIKILISSSKNGRVDSLNVKDATDGNTPLLIAAERNDAQCLSLLLSSSISSSAAAAAAAVDLNIQNNRGKTILNLLIEHKAARAIQELLSKHSLDPNIPDAAHDNSTSLVLAMKLRCFDIVRLLLDMPSTSNNSRSRCAVDSNICDIHGNTALILACDMKHEEMAALLLKHGADPDMSNSEGDSPLIIATKNKSPEIIKLLLKSNSCFKDVVDGKGNTAVIWAAWKGFPDCLKLLLDHGCWCNAQNTVLKNTALCLVADKGDMDLVCLKLLLTAGADPNIVDGNGEGPLHLATRNGSIESVKLLIKAGSDKDAPGHNGNNALLIAMKAMATGIGTVSRNGTGDYGLTNGQWMTLIKYLITDAQVNPNVQDREQGSSPLMIAAGMVNMGPSFNSTAGTVASAGIECMKMLLSAGSKTELQEGSGSKNTALLIATQRQNVEGVSLLLKYGADPDVRDCNGDSPIILAAKQQQQQPSSSSSEGGGAPPSSSSCLEILKLLLKNGAYVDMKDNGGDTALIWAIKSRNIVFVRELLVQHQKQSIKCNINAAGVNNNTALILAASTDQPDCVAMLIAGGADLEMCNVYGTSAMKAAVALRDQKCRMILMGAGAVDSYGGINGIMAEGSVVGTKEGGAPAPGTGFSTAPSGSLTPEGNMDARTTAKVAGGALSCIAAVFLIVLECV